VTQLIERVPSKPSTEGGQPLIGELERQAQLLGLEQLIGVDEAGRGPWAGPVVAAAVIFPPWSQLPAALSALNDSKQLKEQQRRALLRPIAEHALALGVGYASAASVDELNVLQATFSAMRQALYLLTHRLERAGHPLSAGALIAVDGRQVIPQLTSEAGRTLPTLAQHPLISGDARSWSVAAASVIAKVTRDERMAAYARHYPAYGFERHKGYGTAQHQSALRQLGPCPIHRLSYKPIKALLASAQP